MHPSLKEFNKKIFSDAIKSLNKRTPLKDIEKIGNQVAKHILRTREGFKKVKPGPTYAGTQFDLFGFNGKKPYMIELKAGLHSFAYPKETQKQRMQELLKNIQKLHVALIQIKLKEGKYRIFYDNQMDLLFHSSKMPLGSIEKWIKDRI